MSEDEKFASKDGLEKWLKSRRVDERKAAAAMLFPVGYDEPASLIGISSDALRRAGLSDPPAQTLNTKLEKKQYQQRDDENDSILGKGVYEKLTKAMCFFRDEDRKPI